MRLEERMKTKQTVKKRKKKIFRIYAAGAFGSKLASMLMHPESVGSTIYASAAILREYDTSKYIDIDDYSDITTWEGYCEYMGKSKNVVQPMFKIFQETGQNYRTLDKIGIYKKESETEDE